MAVVIIYIGQIPILAPTFNNTDPLFTLLITAGFYMLYVEVVDPDPAIGRSISRSKRLRVIFDSVTAWDL